MLSTNEKKISNIKCVQIKSIYTVFKQTLYYLFIIDNIYYFNNN